MAIYIAGIGSRQGVLVVDALSKASAIKEAAKISGRDESEFKFGKHALRKVFTGQAVGKPRGVIFRENGLRIA